jgi:hypothetical protein
MLPKLGRGVLAAAVLVISAGCQGAADNPVAPGAAVATPNEKTSAFGSESASSLSTAKVDICHSTGRAKHFILITVAESAVAAHLAHGDGHIGDPVPGQNGMVFGSDCTAIPGVPLITDINVPLTGRRTGFGEGGAAFFAQTFIAIGTVAEQLTVYVGPTTGPQVSFRILITEFAASPAFGPTSVLFESGTLTKSLSFPLEPEAFTVALGTLPLELGRTYAIVLDACSEFDGTRGSTQVGIDLSASYPAGVFFSMPPGTTQPAPCDRSLLFASHDWIVQENIDLAFTLTFASSVGGAPD